MIYWHSYCSHCSPVNWRLSRSHLPEFQAETLDENDPFHDGMWVDLPISLIRDPETGGWHPHRLEVDLTSLKGAPLRAIRYAWGDGVYRRANDGINYTFRDDINDSPYPEHLCCPENDPLLFKARPCQPAKCPIMGKRFPANPFLARVVGGQCECITPQLCDGRLD